MTFWQSNSLQSLAAKIREEHAAVEDAKGAATVDVRSRRRGPLS
jgi:hypothetical protein